MVTNFLTQLLNTTYINESELKENSYYREKLLSMGVKAYHCNNGRVDRAGLKVTFFDDYDTPDRFQWGGYGNLKEGDKIFIGDPSDGGRFAVITGVDSIWSASQSYNFKRLDETLGSYEKLKRAEEKAIRKAERKAYIEDVKELLKDALAKKFSVKKKH